MISLAWKKRAIPFYWKILTHKEASNLTEKKSSNSSSHKIIKRSENYNIVILNKNETLFGTIITNNFPIEMC